MFNRLRTTTYEFRLTPRITPPCIFRRRHRADNLSDDILPFSLVLLQIGDDSAAPEYDDAVDRWRASITRGLIDAMTRDSRGITAATHLLFAAQKLERIGDHAVGIAEMVAFAAGAEEPGILGEDLP